MGDVVELPRRLGKAFYRRQKILAGVCLFVMFACGFVAPFTVGIDRDPTTLLAALVAYLTIGLPVLLSFIKELRMLRTLSEHRSMVALMCPGWPLLAVSIILHDPFPPARDFGKRRAA